MNQNRLERWMNEMNRNNFKLKQGKLFHKLNLLLYTFNDVWQLENFLPQFNVPPKITMNYLPKKDKKKRKIMENLSNEMKSFNFKKKKVSHKILLRDKKYKSWNDWKSKQDIFFWCFVVEMM